MIGSFLRSLKFKEIFVLFVFVSLSYLPVLFSFQQVSPDAYFILPLFEEIGSFGNYFEYLFSLRTVDFQPIRDLSLFVDWVIFQRLEINTFILQNIFWWTLGCYFLLKLIRLVFENMDEKTSFLLVITFAVYPLFSSAVCWTIARKHILSFTFIMIATYYLWLFIKTENKKFITFFTISYLIAELAQPIGMLWCFWAIGVIFLLNKQLLRVYLIRLIPIVIIFIFIFIMNYIYYEKSPFFSFTYNSKTINAFNLRAQVLSFFYYFFRYVFPFQPVTNAYLVSFFKPILGFVFFFIITSVYFYKKLDKRYYFIFFSLILYPLLTVLNTPELLFDTYLLIPMTGFFFLICSFVPSSFFPKYHWILWGFILLFGAYSASESIFWTDSLSYNARNFSRAPSCTTARVLANSYYSIATKPPEETLEYIHQNNCLNTSASEYNSVEILVFKSLLVRYEKFDDEVKIKILNELGDSNFFPNVVLAELYLQNKKNSEADAAIGEAIKMLEGQPLIEMYDTEILKNTVSYCEYSKNQICLNTLGKILRKRTLPYL